MKCRALFSRMSIKNIFECCQLIFECGVCWIIISEDNILEYFLYFS